MWVWLSLLLGVCVEATSNGVAMTCEVNQPNLGSAGRNNKNMTMWWVLPPKWATMKEYTLRTADTDTTTSDPTGYVPGQWLDIYIRTTFQDQQFTGLILYATNAAGQKVGKWQIPSNAPFHVMPNEACVVHSNADPKNYLSTFKFQGPPVGTGKITIKALVKFGLAFPSNTGTFYWPNAGPFELSEKPQTTQLWFEGELGQSCITVCQKQNMGCDLAAMKALGNVPANILAKIGPYSNCTGPLLPGCFETTPSFGSAGCFYHSDTCVQPPVVASIVRPDICMGLPTWVAGTQYCGNGPACVNYKGAKWCCRYGATTAPDDKASNPSYGPWGVQGGGGPKGMCMPAGGWPVPLVPVRNKETAREITCGAVKTNTATNAQDGRRICACGGGGGGGGGGGLGQEGSSSQVVLPVAALIFSVIASF